MNPAIIDSHAHLDMKAFDQDRDLVLERALGGGISQIITIGIDLPSSKRARDLADQYEFIFATVGFHPHMAEQAGPEALKEMEGLASEPKVVAWGEIGLDFYRNLAPPDIQRKVFEEQLQRAERRGLPVVIHSRNAHEETLKVLKTLAMGERKGVIHCFSGDCDLAMTFIELGFYISIPGTVTYPKAHQVQDVAARVPLEYLLMETDAPFLKPIQACGNRNEPLFITHTAQRVAQLRNIDLEVLARQTSANVKRLFNLP